MSIEKGSNQKNEEYRPTIPIEIEPDDAEKKLRELAVKQREDVIDGLVKHQIETNPNSEIQVESSKKRWTEFFDNANQGDKNDMRINEIYAQKCEKAVVEMKNKLAILEEKLKLVDNERKKEDVLEEIRKTEKDIEHNEQEAVARRGYAKPKKKK